MPKLRNVIKYGAVGVAILFWLIDLIQSLFDLPEHLAAMTEIFTNLDFWLLEKGMSPTLTAIVFVTAFGLVVLPDIWPWFRDEVLRSKEFADAYSDFQTEFNSLSDEREIFQKLFQRAYEKFRDNGQNWEALVDSAKPLEFVPVAAGEDISKAIAGKGEQLRGASKSLWEFCEALALETDKREHVVGMGALVFDDDEAQTFHGERKKLAKFWNKHGEKIIYRDELRLGDVQSYLRQQKRFLRMLSYIEATRAIENSELSEGKQWLFTLARGWTK